MTTTLLTVPEAAEKLRVNPSTVRRWIASGTLSAHRPGRDFRIPAEAVDALLARSA